MVSSVKYTIFWLLFVLPFGLFSYYSHHKMHEGVEDAQLTVLMGDVNSTYDGLKILEVFPESRQDYGFNQFMSRGTVALDSDGTRILARKEGRDCLIMNVTRSAAIRATNGRIPCTHAMVAVLGSGKVLDRFDSTYNGEAAYVAGRVMTRQNSKGISVAYVLLSERPVESVHAEAQKISQGIKYAFFVITILSAIGFWLLHRTQQKQRRSAIENKLTLESVQSGIIRIDETPEGIIQSVNPAMIGMFGYDSASEMLGKPVDIIIPDEYKKAHHAGVDGILAGADHKILGKQSRSALSGLRKDGSTFPISLTVDELILPEGRQFSGVIADLTEESKARDRIERQLTSMRRIGYMFRHDVANHLTPVQTALKYLEKTGKYSEKAVSLGRREIGNALMLSHSLSEQSRLAEQDIQDLVKVKTDISSLVNDVKPEGIELILSDLGFAECDQGILQGAFRNLFENAQKYTEGDAKAKVYRIDNAIIFEDNAGGFACVDNTYSQEEADRMMSPRERGRSDVLGSGLGLFNIKTSIELHGWEFSHESECGIGTKWVVQIK